MISSEKYVPILKGKAAEFQALSKFDASLKDNIIPLIELVPFIAKSTKLSKKAPKTFDDYINSVLSYFKKWDKSRLIYIDGYMIDDNGPLKNGDSPMDYLLNNLINTGFNVRPVFNSVLSLEHKAIIKKISLSQNKGIGLRLFSKPINEINLEIEENIAFLELQPEKIDLIIDLRSLLERNLDEISHYVTDLIFNLQYLNKWRSFVMVGSSFPIDLSELTPEQVHIIKRKNWLIWQKLILGEQVERIPAYGDYTISHPSISVIEGIPNASASIRYTHENNFYIYRGRGTRQYGFEQYFDISETLIHNEHFYGQYHCAGDEFIFKCGTEKVKKGNLTTWRWVGTIHHITVVVNQLRQFFRDLRV